MKKMWFDLLTLSDTGANSKSQSKAQLTKHVLISCLVGAGALMTGCRMHPEQTKLQYMPDMVDNPTVKTQEDFLPAPEFAVAMDDLLYPDTVEEADSLKMPSNLPTAGTSGEELYNTFCSVCHGSGAKGGVTRLGETFPPPPDLTHSAYKSRTDGFYYYRITFGSAIMPGYGHAIDDTERWKIVKHLRKLQAM